MEPIKTDVLIVGAGAGGAILAALLGRLGHDVTVVERRTSPSLNGADVLKPSGIAVLQRLGVVDDLLARGGRRRTEVAVFHDRVRVHSVDYAKCSELGHFITVPYAVVVTRVHELLATLPSVRCLFGAEIASFVREDGQLRGVRLADGRVVTARVVVGADGASSRVREELGIVVDRWQYEQRMFFGRFRLVPSVEALNRLYVDSRDGIAYFYPVGADALRAVIALPHTEADQVFRQTSDPAALRDRLRRFVSESDDAIEAIDDPRSFAEIPIGCMHSSTYGVGATVLLGDAVHTVHPIAGQGMNLSIEDAGTLADVVSDALCGRMSPRFIAPAFLAERFATNDAVVTYGHQLATTLRDVERFKAAFNPRLQASGRAMLDLSGVTAEEIRFR